MSTPKELSAQQKMDALQNHDGNSDKVAKLESAGHAASTAVSVATMGYGAISAFGTGGIGAVACYAAPLAAGVAGIMAGAALVDHFALDEKLLDFMGKPKLARPGPQPATIGHPIAHSSPFAGALGGLLAAVVGGALVDPGQANLSAIISSAAWPSPPFLRVYDLVSTCSGDIGRSFPAMRYCGSVPYSIAPATHATVPGLGDMQPRLLDCVLAYQAEAVTIAIVKEDGRAGIAAGYYITKWQKG